MLIIGETVGVKESVSYLSVPSAEFSVNLIFFLKTAMYYFKRKI